MATKEVGLNETGEYVAREQGGKTLARLERHDTKDFKTCLDYWPFDFELASAASAQSLMGSVATAGVLIVEVVAASDDVTPKQATLTVDYGSGAVVMTGSIFRIQQATASIVSATIAQSAGVTCRIRGFVAGT